jgi:hypothetical protein
VNAPVNGPRGPFDDHEHDHETHDEDEQVAALLRATLTREADMVVPGDGYGGIEERIARERHPQGRRGAVVWLAAAAAVLVVGGVVGVLALGGDDDPPPAAGTTTTTTTPSPTPSTTTSAEPSTTAPPAGDLSGVAVYWVGDTVTRSWLYREFQTVPDRGDPLTSAVHAVMAGAPLDPDYRSAWSPPSRLEVTQDGDAITVDVSADALADTQVGSEGAALAVQQVVWTATAAAQSPGPVTILVDGQPADAWGAVSLGEPMTRDADAQAQIWIDSPNEGQQVAPGVVTVGGVSTAFEATVNWELTTDDAEVVADGFAMGGANGDFAPYEIATPELTAGTYTIAVWAPDESDGESPEGPRMHEQTRTFTVG